MGLIKRSSLSAKELEARRANARKSTGPRTSAGKARVSLNRLQHGGRSAGFEAFVRRIGLNRRALFALFRSTRLPGEPVSCVQRALVEVWLKSPLPGRSFPKAGRSLTFVGRPPRERWRPGAVENLLSTHKRASVLKALRPDYQQVLTAMVLEDVGRRLAKAGARVGSGSLWLGPTGGGGEMNEAACGCRLGVVVKSF
jgi:hypothetical protein